MQPVSPVGAIFDLVAAQPAQAVQTPAAGSGFGDLVATGLKQVDARVAKADALMQAFAEGQAIPVHQVTLALEQARLSVELAMQIRSRLVETYREFMNMQI